MQLFIHIGPFKTGTTSFQEYMWHNRARLLNEGVLYPRTGIVKQNWGHRHLKLAIAKNDGPYQRLLDEIGTHEGIAKVVLSSERYSQRMEGLADRKAILAPLNPTLVIAIRNEVELARSMYLQIVKSRFTGMKPEQADNLHSFADWFDNYKERLSYRSMLAPWVQAYGAESVIYVPYLPRKDFNVVDALLASMGLPPSDGGRDSLAKNPSIGGKTALWAIRASKLGPHAARLAVEIGLKLEDRYPNLKKVPPRGFDAKAVGDFYAAENEIAYRMFPGYEAAHRLAVPNA